uniref:Uncharacterized protein n=1 Tax=Kalanchoe fedtschenkoi TaxID=63787 RepID=A0A7N1A4H5_KALFE
MPLVDYASSSDEEDAHKQSDKNSDVKSRPISPPPHDNQKVEQPVRQHFQNATSSSEPSIDKLPDASLLLSSPDLSSHMFSSNNHNSRVTAAMAETASRKRTANGSPSSFTRAKLPKGTLLRSRNVSADGLLVPPQLNGRWVGT